ncbi:peptidoglycan-binding protein [Streptomyces sp. NPDC091212]|uniref:peptidoglycan-binding protein n=1 Tax=Streptomyces sp. NPDC091212 TaxID=3155191 RepID=UPI003428DD08
MARMPGAAWRAVRNYTKDGQAEVRGVVVHIMAGYLDGSESWFNNPTSKASSHFGTSRAGMLRQWVDTKDRAWAQAAGNASWLSVENEGFGGDELTDAQLDLNARVLAWAHTTYGVPLQVASDPSGRGLGYHAMGGAVWGGHYACPGPKIVAQLAQIVKRAKTIVGAKDPEPEPGSGPGGGPFPGAGSFGPGADNAYVTRLGTMLVARGGGRFYSVGPGPRWGDADRRATEAFQRAQGWSGADADGLPGPTTWRYLVGGLGKDIPAAAPASPPEFPGRDKFGPGKENAAIEQLGKQLVKKGFGRFYKVGPGPRWGGADRQAVRAFQLSQSRLKGDADGLPGPLTWQLLFS